MNPHSSDATLGNQELRIRRHPGSPGDAPSAAAPGSPGDAPSAAAPGPWATPHPPPRRVNQRRPHPSAATWGDHGAWRSGAVISCGFIDLSPGGDCAKNAFLFNMNRSDPEETEPDGCSRQHPIPTVYTICFRPDWGMLPQKGVGL